MPKVKSTPITAADSASFFAGSTPTAPPEPPMMAAAVEEAQPEPVAAVQPPETTANIKAPPQLPSKVPTAPPAAPKPAVEEPFTLLWSRSVDDQLDATGKVVKYGDKRSLRAAEIKGAGCIIKSSWVMGNGTISEAMCFVPGVVIRIVDEAPQLVALKV